MTPRRVLALVALALAVGACAREESLTREEEVRRAFVAYKTAAMSGEGATAAGLLSSMTVNHFERMRDLALYAPADEVLAHPCVNQLTIFRSRQFLPVEVLRSMSGEQALAYHLSQGWIGRDVVAKVDLGRIELHGSAALAEVLVSGRENGAWHILLEEDGRWRFELLQGYGVFESQCSAAARQHGVGHTEIALAILKNAAGIEIDPPSLLQPLVPPEAAVSPSS